MYSPYVVTHYTNIPSLAYIHKTFSKLPSSVFPSNFSKNMSEYIRKRRNIISNEINNKRRVLMIRKNGENYDLVSLSVDISHEDQGKHKAVRYMLP